MSNSQPASTNRAVFVSYAREDTDAARRIAEALRTHGVEVWFDQNELRGGDVWDTKIRRQIADCALFLPVVSQHTQERSKGYFRLEWKLAVEQTHLMAEGVPYLTPVAIDDTAESSAVVPPEFMKVQWTRLAGALPTTQFVEQIKRLLEAPRKAAPGAHANGTPGTLASPALHSSGFPKWITAALSATVLALVAYVLMRPTGRDTMPARKPVAEMKPASPATAPSPPALAPLSVAATTLANAKSVAVLPFANRSADSGDAFFTDGMHEDILTNLARIRELQVTSRTSVEQYRATTKAIPQIGRELNVAYILEGSVQRAGNTVRITGQLINARTDEHVWAQSFDRELTTANVFSIQSELAQAIAREMKAAISPEEKKLLARRPTENLAAYEAHLKAREKWNQPARDKAALEKLEILCQVPVALDPNFALAWAELSWAHGYQYFFNFDHTAARVAKAKAAIDNAVRLAPDAPETTLNLGYFHYFCLSDYARALEFFERADRLQPNVSLTIYSIGLIHRRMGKWLEAVDSFRRSAEAAPTSTFPWNQLGQVLLAGRRFDEAGVAYLRLAALPEGEASGSSQLAVIPFSARGSKREMEAYLNGLSEEAGFQKRLTWAAWTGNLPEVIRLDALRPGSGAGRAETMAMVLAAQGDLTAARTRLQSFPEGIRSRLLSNEAENARLWGTLGRIEAILGHKDEALRAARKAVELVPESVDSDSGPPLAADLAFVYAWTGDRDRAIAEYGRLLRTPAGGQNIHRMKLDPMYAPLRGDPRFEALLNDPKNNAPLF